MKAATARTHFSYVTFLLVSLLRFDATAQAQGNDSANVLPVCSIVSTAEVWNSLDPLTVFTGGEPGVTSDSIGRGLSFDCASQHRMIYRTENVEGGTKLVADHLEALSSTNAIPNTINPAAGNGQIITLSVGAGVIPNWPGCMPASANCPPAKYLTDNFGKGVVFVRQRSADQTFKGGWTSAFQSYDPGFTLRRLPSCTSISQSTCDYELIFRTDFDGNPVFAYDTQLILKIGFAIREGDRIVYLSDLGIPLYISRADSAAATPTPTPSPTATPLAPIPSDKCVVPELTSRNLNDVKQAIKRGHCKVGTVTRVFSASVARNAVISLSPKSGRILPLNKKVNIKVSAGKKPSSR